MVETCFLHEISDWFQVIRINSAKTFAKQASAVKEILEGNFSAKMSLYRQCGAIFHLVQFFEKDVVQRMMLSLSMCMSPNLCLFVCCWIFDWLQWRGCFSKVKIVLETDPNSLANCAQFI